MIFFFVFFFLLINLFEYTCTCICIITSNITRTASDMYSPVTQPPSNRSTGSSPRPLKLVRTKTKNPSSIEKVVNPAKPAADTESSSHAMIDTVFTDALNEAKLYRYVHKFLSNSTKFSPHNLPPIPPPPPPPPHTHTAFAAPNTSPQLNC